MQPGGIRTSPSTIGSSVRLTSSHRIEREHLHEVSSHGVAKLVHGRPERGHDLVLHRRALAVLGVELDGVDGVGGQVLVDARRGVVDGAEDAEGSVGRALPALHGEPRVQLPVPS